MRVPIAVVVLCWAWLRLWGARLFCRWVVIRGQLEELSSLYEYQAYQFLGGPRLWKWRHHPSLHQQGLPGWIAPLVAVEPYFGRPGNTPFAASESGVPYYAALIPPERKRAVLRSLVVGLLLGWCLLSLLLRWWRRREETCYHDRSDRPGLS